MKSLSSLSLRLLTSLLGKRMGLVVQLLWYVFTGFIDLIDLKQTVWRKVAAWTFHMPEDQHNLDNKRHNMHFTDVPDSITDACCWLWYARRKEPCMPVRSHGEFAGMKVSKNILSCTSRAYGSWKSETAQTQQPTTSFLPYPLSHWRSAWIPAACADAEITLNVNKDTLSLTLS